jgi:uncharacterized membrane protein
MRPIRLASWALLLAMVAIAAVTYGGLPDRIPVHLDLNGVADRTAPKSVLGWFLLPGAACLVLALIDFLGSRLPAQPDLLNIPDKERLLALPPRFQAPVMREAQHLMDVVAVGTMAIMLLVQWEFVRVASGARGLGVAVVLVASLGLTVGLLLMVSRITGALDRAHAQWREQGSPAA